MEIKVKKIKAGYSFKYKDKTLIQLNISTLTNLVCDLLPRKNVAIIAKKLIELKGTKKGEIKKSKSEIVALQMINSYIKRKRKHYRNNGIKAVTAADKDYKHFLSAAKICVSLNVDVKTFIEAQIDGLSFLNDGNGIFPNPNHLSTPSAQDRVLQYITDDDSDEKSPSKKKVNTINLIQKDYELELMKNPRFVRAYDRLMKNKATLAEAYFVGDCMLAKKDYITEAVEKKIKGLEKK